VSLTHTCGVLSVRTEAVRGEDLTQDSYVCTCSQGEQCY